MAVQKTLMLSTSPPKPVLGPRDFTDKHNREVHIVIFVLLILSLSLNVFLLMQKLAKRAEEIQEQIIVNATFLPVKMNQSEIISRREWLAVPPRDIASAQLPTKMVIIAHTVTQACEIKSKCLALINTIQRYHQDKKGWDDIAYNFLIGGDGRIYAGRGWGVVGSHTKGFNRVSIGIAFIGNFEQELPPQEQLKAAKEFLDFGVRHGHLASNYTLFGHRQLTATESPGDALFNEIRKWPHWSDGVELSQLRRKFI